MSYALRGPAGHCRVLEGMACVIWEQAMEDQLTQALEGLVLILPPPDFVRQLVSNTRFRCYATQWNDAWTPEEEKGL